jgi:hypothetical protein
VKVNLLEQLSAAKPAATDGRVHDLHERPVPPPHEHEVRRATWLADNQDGRQGLCLRQQQVVWGEHDLLGHQAKVESGFLKDTDGRAIHVRLAGFAQPTVIDRNAEAFQERLEHGRPAVHGGRLDHLGSESTRA